MGGKMTKTIICEYCKKSNEFSDEELEGFEWISMTSKEGLYISKEGKDLYCSYCGNDLLDSSYYKKMREYLELLNDMKIF